ncbi:hypothetical protein MLD38_026348 [Melastoma candidum]|uniref:Uncharacterized protein n=1 Tax=Melastoma candidum TaxID=119954 RepID=A0ACB9NYB4_9MYRT|nr:hypothetical protein MLD38_026348 [Melastoma candidum]
MGWKENSMFAILFLLREPFYIVSTVLLLLLPLSFLLSSRLSSASYFLSVSHDSSSITDPYPGLASAYGGSGLGNETGLLTLFMFLPGLHYTMIYWCRVIAKPIVDETVLGF